MFVIKLDGRALTYCVGSSREMAEEFVDSLSAHMATGRAGITIEETTPEAEGWDLQVVNENLKKILKGEL